MDSICMCCLKRTFFSSLLPRIFSKLLWNGKTFSTIAFLFESNNFGRYISAWGTHTNTKCIRRRFESTADKKKYAELQTERHSVEHEKLFASFCFVGECFLIDNVSSFPVNEMAKCEKTAFERKATWFNLFTQQTKYGSFCVRELLTFFCSSMLYEIETECAFFVRHTTIQRCIDSFTCYGKKLTMHIY